MERRLDLVESDLFSLCGSWEQTQVVRLGSRRLTQSHLPSPKSISLIVGLLKVSRCYSFPVDRMSLVLKLCLPLLGNGR